MLINSKIPLRIRNKLKKILRDNNILDIIIFGSAVKGKLMPTDIDIAIITKKKNIPLMPEQDNLHISIITPHDIFVKPISLINTLLREGHSLRHNTSFSEVFKFSNKVLFIYNLKDLANSEKVKMVNILRGKKSQGLVEENKGEWLSRQVFLVPVGNEKIFEELFQKHSIKYKKNYVLIH